MIDVSSSLPLLIVLSAMLPGLSILFVDEQRATLRRSLNLGGNVLCVLLIAFLVGGVFQGEVFETRLPLLPGLDFVLHADALSLLFVSLSGALWLITTIYAIGYLQGTQNRSRFFAFFSLCVSATLGIALAGNLITFVIFYELLTLTTYPLVVHKGDKASLRAGRIYLTYTMIGGALLLAGVVWLKSLAGPLDFTATGILSQIPGLDSAHLMIIFGLLITGLGVKAALVPLHGWLPVAMAAPAPVSALLHAVAVVKAGAFGIIRVVYDVYGIEFARDLGLTTYLGIAAAFTIVYGSIRALTQNDIKKRLAFSTVSQVSYIALGTAIAGPIATIGGMVHLVHQGIMKITLFFCAGNLAETLGVHKVSEMNGVGRRMPLTMAAFTIAALGMIGLPPVAGFVSKWYLGTGALEVGAYWVLGVLAASSLLNAMYMLPMVYAAWFKPADGAWSTQARKAKLEAHWMLVFPPVITAALALLAGLFASASISPLSWAKLIAAREYGRESVQWTLDLVLPMPSLLWVVLIPLLLAIGIFCSSSRRLCIVLTPAAALPALAVALLSPTGENVIPWLFFGSVFGFDGTNHIVLALASMLWSAAGLYGLDYLRNDKALARYSLFYLLSMTGSFGLILAQDIFGFITFFTLMSFSAYGLVIHSGAEEALKAGKSYLQWVVIGEVLLFAALVGLASGGDGNIALGVDTVSQPLWVTVLLIVGFGIKAGLLTVHMWLPRAHPVAPIPASALLSGLMVKAGLLGWWRFLPLGEIALPEIGSILLALGLGAAFLAVIKGMQQHNPKALLAYSTISQMGILTAGVGVGLREPVLWSMILPALLLYAVHHGVAKSALFLSVGVAPLAASNPHFRWLIWTSVSIPALALAGLPLSSGAVAKIALKNAVADMGWLTLLLSLTVIGTTCLMARFLDMMREMVYQTRQAPSIGICGFLAYGAVVISLVVVVPHLGISDFYWQKFLTGKVIWTAVWPMLLGLIIYALVRPLCRRLASIPTEQLFPNKINSAIHWITHSIGYFGNTARRAFTQLVINVTESVSDRAAVATEGRLSIRPGIIFLGMLVVMALALGIS